MAAMIEYVCTAQHQRRDEASVTLEQGAWAYCSWGAASGHVWTRIDPTAVEALRARAMQQPHPIVRGKQEETTRPRR